jgi:hypothetical protein
MDTSMKQAESGAVTISNARFSYLGRNVLRLEYAPDGRFDDRPTFRAISMPTPQPFESCTFKGDECVLTAAGFELRYRPNGLLTRDNLTIRWQAGGLRGSWSPGDLDRENLGSALTLDHVGRQLIPQGAHPAGQTGADRIGELNLAEPFCQIMEALRSDRTLDPREEFEWSNLPDRIDVLPPELRQRLDVFRKFPPGPVSRAGYAVLDETGMAFYDPATQWLDRNIRPDYQNLFFFCYGRDYAEALRQFSMLCGKIPMPPRWALGPWYSCFAKLSAEDNQAIVAEFERQGIPLDVLIIDMDWHKNEWHGWDWNEELYPDLQGFFAWKKDAGLKIALNTHSEAIHRGDGHFKKIRERLDLSEDASDPPGVRFRGEPDCWTLDYADREVWQAIRDVCFRPNEQRGVDFWWLDNWQGYQDGYNSNLWINHLVARHLQEDHGVRPLILGRYAGIGSHRYPAYFSGDTCSHWEVLKCLLDVNLKAGHVGMVYFSHDLGGFKGPCPGERVPLLDPELYVRWMQMGALCPVMRVHSDHGIREPWKYGEHVLEIVRAAYELHARLVPYFYHLARDAYDTGLPLHRPLYFLFPEDETAYEVDDQFFLGDQLLAAPVVIAGGRRKVYIPAGEYYSLPYGEPLRGPTTIDRVFSLSQIPLYIRAGAIIPQQQAARRIGTGLPDPLILAIYPGGSNELALYEDDGYSAAYSRGSFTRWPIEVHDDGGALQLTLRPMQGHFEGVLETRTVHVQAHFIARPKRVRVEGSSADDGWTYDDRHRQVSVTLRNISTRGTYRVIIDR